MVAYPPSSFTFPQTPRRAVAAFAFALFLLATAVLSGCGSQAVEGREKYERTGRLEDYRNDLDVDSKQASYPSVVMGTITKTEAAPSSTLMMVKVNSFRVIGASGADASQTRVPPGTEVVIEWHQPEQEPSEGQDVEALVRFVKSPAGLGLIAESVRVIGN
jgi:hypothetical protein